jgi:hypothetical protein
MNLVGSVISTYFDVVAGLWDGGPAIFFFGMLLVHWPIFAALNVILDSGRPITGGIAEEMNPGAQVDALRRAEEYREAERARRQEWPKRQR